MTAIRGNTKQPRSLQGQWEGKLQSAPETGVLLTETSAEDEAARAFRLRKERTLIRSETAFLYSTLGEPGSNLFDSFERIGELAEAESLLGAAD